MQLRERERYYNTHTQTHTDTHRDTNTNTHSHTHTHQHFLMPTLDRVQMHDHKQLNHSPLLSNRNVTSSHNTEVTFLTRKYLRGPVRHFRPHKHKWDRFDINSYIAKSVG